MKYGLNTEGRLERKSAFTHLATSYAVLDVKIATPGLLDACPCRRKLMIEKDNVRCRLRFSSRRASTMERGWLPQMSSSLSVFLSESSVRQTHDFEMDDSGVKWEEWRVGVFGLMVCVDCWYPCTSRTIKVWTVRSQPVPACP